MIHHKDFPFDKRDEDVDIIHIRPSYSRKRGRVKFVLLAFVFAAMMFGGKYFYDQNRGEVDPTKVPLIPANLADFRHKPTDPGGMKIEHMDKEIYDSFGNKIADTEVVIPTAPPEKPIDYDPIAEIIAAEEKGTSPASKDRINVPEKPISGGVKPKRMRADGSIITETYNTPNQHVKAKTIDVAKVLASKKTQEYWAQLGTFASEQEATKAWQNTSEKYSDIVKDMSVKISESDLGPQGVSYRLQAGALASESDAKDFCKLLNERGQSCFYVQTK